MIAALGSVLTLSEADRLKLSALVSTIGAGGEAGARAFLEAGRLIGEAADPVELDAALPDASAPLLDRIVGLVAACFSSVSRAFASRQDAQAARTTLAGRADPTIDEAGALFGADLHSFLVRLLGEALVRLSAEAATRAPLVRVETGVSLPSSLLAYDLYGDPNRGAELTTRNRVATPMLMPVAFEAQAN